MGVARCEKQMKMVGYLILSFLQSSGFHGGQSANSSLTYHSKVELRDMLRVSHSVFQQETERDDSSPFPWQSYLRDGAFDLIFW